MASLYFSYAKQQSPHHPSHRDYLHPKKSTTITPHGEDLPYRQFCRWFKFAAHMINRNFEKSRVYFKAVPPLFRHLKRPYTVIFNHLTKPIVIKVVPLFLIQLPRGTNSENYRVQSLFFIFSNSYIVDRAECIQKACLVISCYPSALFPPMKQHTSQLEPPGGKDWNLEGRLPK